MMVGYVTNFYLLIVACSLIGLGSSIYLPAAKSFLVNRTDDNKKVEILSIRVILSNVGVALGPVIGLAVFDISPVWLFTSVGLVFASLLFLNLRLSDIERKKEESNPIFSDFNKLLKNKKMVITSILMFIFIALYMQIEVTIPMFSNDIFGKSFISAVFIINALMVILFQMPLSKWACKESNTLAMPLGFLFFSASFLLLFVFEHSYLALFFSVIIFSVAEIIFQIRLDFDATNIDKRMIATTFGLMSLAGAFGGLFGSFIGALLYSTPVFGLGIWAILTIATVILTVISFFSLRNIEVVYA